MAKDPKKILRMLVIVSIVTGIVATVTAVIALGMKEYVISAAMFLVAGWQVTNVLTWRKKC